MKIFNATRKIFDVLGIHHQAFEKFSTSIRFWVVLIDVVVFCIFALIGLLFKAKFFQEYSDFFYVFVTALAAIVFLFVSVGSASNIFNLIEEFESTIAKSAYDTN